MSLIQFLRIFLARKWMIVSLMLACFSVATIVGLMLPKQYPAEAQVLLNLIRPDPVTGEKLGRDTRSYVKTQIELIRNMRVAGLVVDRLHLADNPTTIAAYQQSGRRSGIRAWIGQNIINNTSAKLVSGSNILAIQYVTGNPDQARQIVAALRDAYLDSTLQFKVDTASRTGDWYLQQADKARQELNEAEGTLSKYMQENGIVAQNGMDSEQAKLESLRGSLSSARSSQAQAETGSTVRLAADPVVDNLRMQLASVEDELALAATRLGPEHPQYKAILARRDTVLKQIRQAQSSTRAGVGAVTSASSGAVARLEAQVAAQEAIVLKRKPILDKYEQLQHEVDLKRQQYTNTATRTAQLRLEADSSEAGIVILGDPTGSRTPAFPNIPLIMALSIGAGLALGLMAALIAEFIARRIRGPEDLAYAAGVPVFATIGTPAVRPLRYRIQRLLGRRRKGGGTELQVV